MWHIICLRDAWWTDSAAATIKWWNIPEVNDPAVGIMFHTILYGISFNINPSRLLFLKLRTPFFSLEGTHTSWIGFRMYYRNQRPPCNEEVNFNFYLDTACWPNSQLVNHPIHSDPSVSKDETSTDANHFASSVFFKDAGTEWGYNECIRFSPPTMPSLLSKTWFSMGIFWWLCSDGIVWY